MKVPAASPAAPQAASPAQIPSPAPVHAGGSSPAPRDSDLRVRAEQVRTQYASMPTSFLGSVFSATLYVVAAHDVLDGWRWMLWWGLMLAQAAARGLLWRAFRRAQPGPAQMRPWGRRAIAGSAASGCIWGLGAVLVFPHGHIEYELLFMFLIASMGSISAIASASFLPAFYAYTFPTVLPIALQLIARDETLLQVMGVIALGYLPVISRFAHNLGDAVVESFRLRFENLDLLREVTARKEQAEDANREKSMFLAAASHDLRQPLHALALQAHVLGQTALTPPQRASLGSIEASVEAMTGLFDALLDVSRLDAGVVPVRNQPVSMQSVFDQLAAEFGSAARAKNLALRLRPTRSVVYTDAHLLATLLRNLVSNAIRYTDHGGVLVCARRRGRVWRVQVWDTGIGIAPEHQRAVFKAFFQVGNAERDRSRGLGLGLAITERIADLLRLPLQLRSQPGHGTVFSVDLQVGTATRPVATPGPAGDPGRLEGACVLVLDNEAESRAAMAALLESWGCRVITAATAEEAVRRSTALTAPPQLLVCDFRLGGGATGPDVIERLREEFNLTIPALVITGDTGGEVLRLVQDSGCLMLHKPVQPARLRESLLQLLARSSAAP
ncbi:MAG: response regulator [Burkholderiales bacterium]|nr:response regulator [Burkholderiales bacterium]